MSNTIIKIVRTFITILLVCGLMIPIGHAEAESGSTLSNRQKQRIISKIDSILQKKAFAFQTDFSNWDTHVRTHSNTIMNAESPEAFANALREALSEFNISHLNINPPRQTVAKKQAKHIGVVGIYMVEINDEFIVNKIAKTSPAYQAGIRKLDTIIEIDGHDPQNAHKHYQLDAKSRHVRWMRDGTEYENDIKIYPFQKNDPPSLEWIEDEIALIHITTFSNKLYHRSKTAKLIKKAKNAKGIILDIRGNFGGLTYNYLHLVSRFAPKGEVLNYRIDKSIYKKTLRKTGNKNPTFDELLSFAKKVRFWKQGRIYQGPVVILIDEFCSSGGELFPAVLKELTEATLIGRKTEGALIAAMTKNLPYGYSIQYPIYEIATPQKRRLEGIGQEPDQELSIHQTADDDHIYKVAIDALGFSN